MSVAGVATLAPSRPVAVVEPARGKAPRNRTNTEWLQEMGWPAGHLGLGLSATLDAKTFLLPAANAHLVVKVVPETTAVVFEALRRYLGDKKSLTQSIRIEGAVAAPFFAGLKGVCPNLRVLDLSACELRGDAVACVHWLAHFNQLHELNLDLTPLAPETAAAVLEVLGTDAASPLVTLRVFGCHRLDLVQRTTHKRLFALPQLRVLQFYQVASATAAIGTRWDIAARVPPEPFQTNGALLLVHRERPPLPPVAPHARNQIILPF